MKGSPMAALKLERCGRWLDRAAVGHAGFAMVDRDMSLLWASDGQRERFANALEQVGRPGFDSLAGEGLQSRPIGRGTRLYFMPVAAAGQVIGCIATIAEPAAERGGGADFDGIAELMGDAADALRDEHSTNHELDSLSRELADRYEELHLVYDIDRHLVRRDLDVQMIEELLGECAGQLACDIALFVWPERDVLLSRVDAAEPIHNFDLVQIEARGDLFRFVKTSRASLVMNDAADPRRAYVFTDMPFRVLASPVLRGDDVPAMVVLLRHPAQGEFTNSDRRMAEVMANHLSMLLQMQQMLSEMRAFTEQMAATLIEAVEAKDPYTRGHSERVHHISVEIGRALGLSGRELEDLSWGSLLHDVGKIGIPDAVLCKPAKLTEDEYTFVKVHPERSYEILRHIDQLKDAVAGARHHQERFDGTGYPHRLRGKAIPLNARIIAVADTYDSITSSRAYRPGRPHEDAMREIDRVSGSQLDPDIVSVFRDLCSAEPDWIRRFRVRREPACA